MAKAQRKSPYLSSTLQTPAAFSLASGDTDIDPVTLAAAQAQGVNALKSGQTTMDDLLANFKNIKKSPYAAPTTPEAEKAKTDATLAVTSGENAANNMKQFQAQMATPPPVAAGSGLTQENTALTKNTQSDENTVGMKDTTENKVQNTAKDQNTQKAEDLLRTATDHFEEAKKNAAANQYMTSDQARGQRDNFANLPEFQRLAMGNDQTGNLIGMAAQAEPQNNNLHGLAVLADMMSIKPSNLSSQYSQTQETLPDRIKTILGQHQKLQDDRRQEADSMRAAILGSKSGTITTTQTLQDRLKELQEQKNIMEQVKALTSDTTNTTGQTATSEDKTKNELVNSDQIKATATDPTLKGNSGQNLMERQDRLDYRKAVDMIDKDPTLRQQLQNGFGISSQFHQLALPSVTPQQVHEAMQMLRKSTQGGSVSIGQERADTYMDSLDRRLMDIAQKYGSTVENIPINDPQLVQIKQELAAASTTINKQQGALIEAKGLPYRHVMERHPDWFDDYNSYAGAVGGLTKPDISPKGVVKQAQTQSNTKGYTGAGQLPQNATIAQKQARLKYLQDKGGQ